MATSANVDLRQLRIGYLVILKQLKEEHEVVYGLDLFDRIDLCRKLRDDAYLQGNVVAYSFYESRRNLHIDNLSRLLESARTH